MSSAVAQPEPLTMRFGGLDIAYDDRVLRPRPWTASQSRWAAEVLREAPPGPVLELCCGAGHIGLLSVLDSSRHLVAIDADAVACDYALGNAAAAGLADRVEVRVSALDRALGPDERFPVVIADPPWVPSGRTDDYPEDPVFAIDGGTDGLAIARLCVQVAGTHLAPGGTMLLQLGTDAQARDLADMLDELAPSLAVGEVRQPGPTGVLVSFSARTR